MMKASISFSHLYFNRWFVVAFFVSNEVVNTVYVYFANLPLFITILILKGMFGRNVSPYGVVWLNIPRMVS